MKLRGLKFLLAACIVCFIWSTAAEAQLCMPQPDLGQATDWLLSPPHPFAGFGLRFATVNYSSGPNAPSQQVLTVLEDAVFEWNTQGCRTGIILLPTFVDGDLEFARNLTDSGFTGGCAKYLFSANEINYGPAFLNRLSTLGTLEATAVMKHEIGHFLGLEETNFPLAPTIMTQGTCATPAAVTSVSSMDATKAAECLGSGSPCPFWFFFPPIDPFACQQGGGYWNFDIGGCFPDPQPEPCVDCMDNDDCCYGDVCHSGVCGPPELFCPPCPPDTVCYEGLCSYATPILIDVDGDGFKMTNTAGGVDFDFTGDGQRQRLPWTAVGSDDAWLVMDRNHNGLIDSGREMFGNVSPQPKVPDKEKNGFISLAEYDKSKLGGNEDGIISNRDYFFRSLRLWTDANHNGVSEAMELRSLDQAGVDVLELEYRLSSRSDGHGNLFRYRAKVKNANGAQLGRWAWDVIFNGRGKQK
jgi:hypothetical protein